MVNFLTIQPLGEIGLNNFEELKSGKKNEGCYVH